MKTLLGHSQRRLRIEVLQQRWLLSGGGDSLAEPIALLGAADPRPEFQKLTADDPGLIDRFGQSVALSGDTALIGAPGDSDAGHGSGSAYIFRFDGSQWVQRQKLTASDAAAGDEFGETVVLSGDTAMLAACRNDEAEKDAGAVYVFGFDGNQWVQQQKLIASDAAELDEFGSSIAISGNTAMIGARNNGEAADEAGAVYVFRHEGGRWLQDQKLMLSDAAWLDHFGQSVAIDGQFAIMGAGKSVSPASGGVAYIFRHDGTRWVQQQQLAAFPPIDSDCFGCSVSISGEFAFAGGNGDSAGDPAYAWVFRFNGSQWVGFQKLGHFNKHNTTVTVRGETAIVGASGNSRIPELEAAHLFRFDGCQWVEQAVLRPSDGIMHDFFGFAVSFDAGRLLVGTPRSEHAGIDTGGAYVFNLAEVVGRHVFYNNSAFDGNNPLPGPQDDLAIATDKQALRACGTAELANYTSYSRGINGIMVDIANLPGVPIRNDFAFRTGNGDQLIAWGRAPRPTSITLQPGEGVDGSDRVTVIWPDGAILGQWLQVEALATFRTGLVKHDVFYFGNAPGESGNSTTDAKVTAADMLAARDNQRNFLDPAPIDFPFDFNRDARVGAVDMLIARNNQTHLLNALKLISIPGRTKTTAKTAAVAVPGSRQITSAELGWLRELERPTAEPERSPSNDSADGAVDVLLATTWA